MEYPSIWYTTWFLEVLPVVCSTVYVETFLHFALLYSRLFLLGGRSSRRPPEWMFYISWCNSDWLIWTLNLEHTCNCFPTTWTTSALSHVWEVTTFIRRFGKSMLKNNCHANVRMATMLISNLFRWLSSEINERYWPQFIAYVSVYNPLFTSSPTHAKQLKKRDPMDIAHCQQEADSET